MRKSAAVHVALISGPNNALVQGRSVVPSPGSHQGHYPWLGTQTAALQAHREILNDGDFHAVIGEYLCPTLAVYVAAAWGP